MSAPVEGTSGLLRYNDALMGTYGEPMRVLDHGQGNYVWDTDGRKYLDLLGGIAVNALGHAHPAWVEAISSQAATLAHASNFFASEPQIALAEKLLGIAAAPPGSRVFFCNSGTEANEAAFKMARKTGRTTMVALENSFHGRSMGALALTYKAAAREPFAPLPGDVTFVPMGDIVALEAAMGPDVGGLILEPIQGESGVRPLPPGYLARARELCDEHGALLILDEVQTGIARTGAWFAHQLEGVAPDVMTLAKGLGGGFPIGAVVAFGSNAGGLLVKGDHGTTFGGNPLACAVALATLNTIESEGLLQHVKAVGEHICADVEALPGVTEVRGAGMLLGIGLSAPIAADVVSAALDAGFIVNSPAPDTVRLIPALTLTADEADTFIAWLSDYLGKHLAQSQSQKTEAAS